MPRDGRLVSRPVRLLVLLSAALLLALTRAVPATAPATQAGPAHLGSVVVDVGSGEVLHAWNANRLGHPASLTKMMTAYVIPGIVLGIGFVMTFNRLPLPLLGGGGQGQEQDRQGQRCSHGIPPRPQGRGARSRAKQMVCNSAPSGATPPRSRPASSR